MFGERVLKRALIEQVAFDQRTPTNETAVARG